MATTNNNLLFKLSKDLQYFKEKTLNKVVVLVKDSQNKLLELEAKAKTAIAEYEKYKAEYDKAFKQLNALVQNNIEGHYAKQKRHKKNIGSRRVLIIVSYGILITHSTHSY